MQITPRAYTPNLGVNRAKTQQVASKESAVTDSVTLGWLAVLPGVGVLANALAGHVADLEGKTKLHYLGLIGSFVNGIGTATAILGLMGANSTALYAGLGMLGASGVSAAIIASGVNGRHYRYPAQLK